jgi:alkylated DNA nucleotide flippase Atl1
MTLTAMRPEVGLSKGREMSLWRVVQASGSISALRVVLRAL